VVKPELGGDSWWKLVVRMDWKGDFVDHLEGNRNASRSRPLEADHHQ